MTKVTIDGPVFEHAVLHLDPGRGEEFEAVFPTANAVIAAADGASEVHLSRFVEQPGDYLLTLRWETLAHHNDGFRRSPEFARWREIIGPFFVRDPEVTHTVPVR